MKTIYEVNLELEPAIGEAFSAWLPGHVERMLELPGFIDAVVEMEERDENAPPTFCVRYRLESRQTLDDYFEHHAARMRQEGIDRFGGRFRATRRILTVRPQGSGTPNFQVRAIGAEQTRPLRQAVLRPHQTPDQLVYPGDDAPDTLHLGAFLERGLIGIASVYHGPPPGENGTGWWRLRGMAILPEAQGKGLGRALLKACLDHVLDRDGTALWCNARTNAAGFYRALGFETIGNEFELEGIGPHFLMKRPIAKV